MIFFTLTVRKQILLCLAISITVANAKSEENECDKAYEAMKEAYYEEEWKSCVELGQTTVNLFKQYQLQLVNCRNNCQMDATSTSATDKFLSLYSLSLLQASCISQCKPGNLKFYSELLKRDPYDYIQICSYKLDEYSKGAAAATTFLVANPSHSYMQTNLENYRKHLNVKEEHFIDLEAGEYESLYNQGLDFYEEEKWLEQAESMVKALDSYHLTYSNCSLLCEGGYEAYTSNYDKNHEAVGAFADQMEKVVRCKHGCRAKLSKINTTPISDIVANIYHHLQYSYSKLGNYELGAAYAAAFLMHNPDDAGMNTNKQYMMDTKEVSADLFKTPEREMLYKDKLDELEQLVKLLDTEYVSQHSDGTTKTKQKRLLDEFLGGAIKVNMTGDKLGGTERFVADGFATQQQCNLLMHICKAYGEKGDGYGKENPHTVNEIFEGLTVETVAKLVDQGMMGSSLLKMYLELSESTRQYTQLYFNLHDLYFDYTHLVCRTAVDPSASRDDLSHPIHSDNCIIEENGTCSKEPPAYTQRDYSGILYLNDNFEGGEFFFADKSLHEQALVQPKCGRLVAFNAGDYHGVKAVQSGRRCAIAVWFTLDPHYNEPSRISALHMLRDRRAEFARDEL